MTAMFRTRVGLFVILLLTLTSLAAGCAFGNDFNKQVSTITKSYKFSIAEWELRTLAGETGKLFTPQEETTENATAQVTVYFNNVTQIKHLEATINAIRAGKQSGDISQLQLEIDELRQKNKEMTEAVSRTLERLARDTLSQQGIYNPVHRYTGFSVGFPPVNVHLADPPRLLIISPRDRIESIKKVTLLPEMSLEEIERIEEEVDRLGVSSLVEGLGGMSTFPSYVDYEADLRFTIDTIVHEWLHQYLAFTPLGFRYILDQTRIRPDYEIATINETVVDIVSKEIGAIVCETYFPQFVTEIPQPQPNNGVFDFNKEMREIRKVVDDYLAWGEIEAAEAFMEQKRQYLAENGYYIRKLNQAYFAFHGTYADSPTSISPIGADLNELREQSVSVKAFLDTVSVISSREDLTNTMEQISSPD
jgi:FtsZ-binding cell division protein ZapB